MTFKAVIFDLDGTLLDTEATAIEAAMLTMAEMDMQPDLAFLESLVGKSDEHCRNQMQVRFPDVDVVAFDRRISEHIKALEQKRGLQKKPFAQEVLAALAASGMPIALATSSRRVRADWKLDASGIAPFFKKTVARDDVENPKPAPDPYILAAQLLNVDAAACLAIEDSDTGAASAKAAGMTVLQVPDVGGVTGQSADHLARNLQDGLAHFGLI